VNESERDQSTGGEALTEPSGAIADRDDWRIVARTKRVNRDWEALIDRTPAAAL
jgi:hypothetical protein